MRKLTTDEFINKAINVHGNEYDYSVVDYTNTRTNVNIICRKHGVFSQSPAHHINVATKCPNCANEKLSKRFASNSDEYINKAIKIHGEKYDYSEVDYVNAKIKIIIKCGKHGRFSQIPANHLNGAGCPKCKASIGEKRIRNFLKLHNIDFSEQVSFENLKDKGKLYYDFYLPDYRLFIEYNGIQHRKPIKFFGGEVALVNNRKRDRLKIDFAVKNKYRLMILPDTINKYLEEALYCELKNQLVVC